MVAPVFSKEESLGYLEQKENTSLKPGSLGIIAIDYVELYVGNALQAAHFYQTALGFTPVVHSSPETGNRDQESFFLQQGDIRIMLTSPLRPSSTIAAQLNLHGEGIKD